MGADRDLPVDDTTGTASNINTTTATTARSKRRKTSGGTGLNDLFIVFFGVAFLLSFGLNLLHASSEDDRTHNDHNTPIHNAVHDFQNGRPTPSSSQKGAVLPHTKNVLPVKRGGGGVVNDDKNPDELFKTKKAEERHPHHHQEERQEQQQQQQEHLYKLKGSTGDPDVKLSDADVDADADAEQRHPPEALKEDPVIVVVKLSTLTCDAFGGPPPQSAQEMVYWADIPSDATYVSPFYDAGGGVTRKYMTFEPDGGGWNNIRMAMESVIGLAVSMGRTLVMPPDKKMYLLAKGGKKEKKHFGFSDFFPMEQLANEHVGLNIITMREYLQTQAMTGHLKNKVTGLVEFPPGNRTDWDGGKPSEYDELRFWLRTVTHTPLWHPNTCLPAFPQSGDHQDVQILQDMIIDSRLGRPQDKHHRHHPTPVDAPASQRLEETLAGRKKLCVYDEQMQAAPTLHFMCAHNLKIRLLVHFYAFLFFEVSLERLVVVEKESIELMNCELNRGMAPRRVGWTLLFDASCVAWMI